MAARVAPLAPGSQQVVAVGDVVTYVGRVGSANGRQFRIHAIDPAGLLYLTPLEPGLSMLGQIRLTSVRLEGATS